MKYPVVLAPAHTLKQHHDGVMAVTFSPDGKVADGRGGLSDPLTVTIDVLTPSRRWVERPPPGPSPGRCRPARGTYPVGSGAA